MLTNRRAARHAPWRPAAIGAATLVLLAAATAAYAGEITDTSCVGGFGSFNCVTRSGSGGDPHVTQLPGALSPPEQTRAAERERRWVARCRPTVAYDDYGVARYRYAAPGCEFGLGEE